MFNKKIHELYGGINVLDGAYIGIEVEMEYPLGVAPPAHELASKLWSVHADGSLLNGMEATTPPILIGSKTYYKANEELAEFFDTNRPMESERSSIHVHLNVSDLTLEQTIKASVAMWALENVLFHFCAPHRRNNHFCIGVSDTVAVIEDIVNSIKEGRPPRVSGERAKYCALNWARLRDLGTLECRIREGLTDATEIFQWADLVSYLSRAGASFKGSPTDLISAFASDPLGTTQLIMGPAYGEAVVSCGGENEVRNYVFNNVPLLIPFSGINWNRDYTAKRESKRFVRINVNPRVDDDVIFEDDVIVEFDPRNVVPDLDEQDQLPPPEGGIRGIAAEIFPVDDVEPEDGEFMDFGEPAALPLVPEVRARVARQHGAGGRVDLAQFNVLEPARFIGQPENPRDWWQWQFEQDAIAHDRR